MIAGSSLNEEKINNIIIYELDKMEKIFQKDYYNAVRIFSKFIRCKVWDNKNYKYLSDILVNMNIMFNVIYENTPLMTYELIGEYVKIFRKIWIKHQPYKPTNEEWDNIEKIVDEQITDVIIKKQWDLINPYIEKDTNDEIFFKDLIKIFDDLFKNCILPNESEFILDCRSIKHMYRGAKGEHEYTRLLPNPRYSNLNRWNPEGRCFVYAALEESETIFDSNNNIYHGDMVCLEELRAKKGEKITLGKLRLNPKIKNKKFFNFAYNDISEMQIEEKMKQQQQLLSKKIISNIENLKDIKQIERQITVNQDNITTISSIYLGKTFLKKICDNIFVALDKEEDINPDKKKKCYGAFHVIAEYLEKRGYEGIIYPSTRASCIKQLGKNIVIFNHKDVIYKDNSLKVIEYNEYC